MTTFRSRLLLVALLLSAPALGKPSAAAKPQSADNCSNISPIIERSCVSRRIDRKEELLASTFAKARVAVVRNAKLYSSWDKRADVRFLDGSQKAWRIFVDSNCKVSAAFGGGSNSAITDREDDCYETELDRRVRFLGALADGTLNGP